MQKFNEEFYTDDFDQEMLDFIKENYNIWQSPVLYPFTLNTGNTILRCTDEGEFIVTNSKKGKHLGKQQFKEKISMTNKNTFTKDDLVAGKHVVECRNGLRFAVLDKDVLLRLGAVS